MDALGISTVVLQTLPTHASQAAAPALPQPASSDLPVLPQPESQSFDVQVAEQKRYEAVQRMAQVIANVYVVSDRTFTIFKDTTGQYVTRFTSLRDGRVTYIPEPQLVKMSQAEAPVLKIMA